MFGIVFCEIVICEADIAISLNTKMAATGIKLPMTIIPSKLGSISFLHKSVVLKDLADIHSCPIGSLRRSAAPEIIVEPQETPKLLADKLSVIKLFCVFAYSLDSSYMV